MPELHDINPRALARGAELFGEEHTRRRLSGLAQWDAGFARLFADYVYGGMYDRDVLEQKNRELCAIAALTVLQRPQLASHIRAALRSGATREEVLEVVLQMSLYGGMPVTLSALEVLKEVLEKEGTGQR